MGVLPLLHRSLLPHAMRNTNRSEDRFSSLAEDFEPDLCPHIHLRAAGESAARWQAGTDIPLDRQTNSGRSLCTILINCYQTIAERGDILESFEASNHQAL